MSVNGMERNIVKAKDIEEQVAGLVQQANKFLPADVQQALETARAM